LSSNDTVVAPTGAEALPLSVRRRTAFVLWAPTGQAAPALVIGPYDARGGFDPAACGRHPLRPAGDGLWELPAAACALADGVYGYWFEVSDCLGRPGAAILMTDPMAWAVDRANPAPSGAPASVVRVRGPRLEPADPVASDLPEEGTGPDHYARLPANTSMVIYELPTRWVSPSGGPVQSADEVGVGTFQDVLALVSPQHDSPHFGDHRALAEREHLVELGVNSLELLPPADSPQSLEWGYGTSNYFAADFDLGRPQGAPRSSATAALRRLIAACHARGIRFIQDVAMAFAVDHPYFWIGPDKFFRGPTPYGGLYWAYHGEEVTAYDPATGAEGRMHAARSYMLACVEHWLSFFRIDGARLDYVEGIDDWRFVREYCAHARRQWNLLGGPDDRFWVVAEELMRPAELTASGAADAAWDDSFKRYVRQLSIGVLPDGLGFGDAVARMIDCTRRGFTDGSKALIYIGSHDLTNDTFSDRFHDWLASRGVIWKQRHIELAFACLLTAVGIPMILAGDEFADQRDLAIGEPAGRNKQIDPVNFERWADPWRRDVFDYVSRLVKLRTRSAALARNECRILHVDATAGRRVAAWQRGAGDDLVVVVANFSDFASEGGLAGEYVIPGWPDAGRPWLEVSQTATPRPVEHPGREPLFPWEAKVYVTTAPPT
jgi:1,4-alpha-glucan branching enzyme